jgi:hypothetical protein
MSEAIEKTNEDKRYTERIYARCTKSQHQQLNEIRIRMGKENISEVVRLAVVDYLDKEGDSISSRRHFNQTMNKRFDDLYDGLFMMLTLIAVLIAQGFAVLLRAIDKSGKEWKAKELLVEASKLALEQQMPLRTTISKMVEVQRDQQKKLRKGEDTET